MINAKDKKILRELAKKVNEIANLPIMAERKKRWYAHNALGSGQPMVLCYPEGSWCELLPESKLTCESTKARRIEYILRERIYIHEHINDDSVTSNTYKIHKKISALDDYWIDIDWGLPIKRRASTQERGGYGFEPIIKHIDDINLLRIPTLEYDENATMTEYHQAQELFDDILEINLSGVNLIGFHIMYFYTHYRGLEQTFLDFYDEPEMAHALVGFFEMGLRNIVDQLAALDLLSLNNDGAYVSTGGCGYTDELPQEGFSGCVRPIDMWASAEAQELAVVSPEQSEEFVISAERRLLSRFGLTGYGCCEPIHDKLSYILSIPNIRRISVSPFSDVRKSAEQIGKKCVFSWKPQPFFVSSPTFDEDAARKYIAGGLSDATDTVLEMILADTHTCHNEPNRFARWVKLCREEIEKNWKG